MAALRQQGEEIRRATGAPVTSRLRPWAPAVTALVVAGTLTGCGGTAPAPGHGASITLYSGQHVQTTDSLVAEFEKATGITVNVRSNDEDTLVDEIVTEGARSPADVIYTENSPALEYLQDKGLLAKTDPSTLAQVPSKYDSPDGDWVGVSARVSVLIYNPRLIGKAELPTSVLQLADPRYKAQLAFAAGETDFQPIVTSVAQAYGTKAALQWLEGIKANAGAHIYPDNETIADEVNRGAVAFGVVNQYYWYRMRAEIGATNVHSEIAYFAPHDPGYVVDVSGAAVLKSSTHQAAAQRFVAYLVSKQAQAVIAEPAKSISFEYPLVAGVTTLAPEPPFNELEPYPITVSQLGDGSTAINLLQQAGLL
ncbi:MAG: extracellular solute-binding protein [Acidimicrobiales bacterium]